MEVVSATLRHAYMRVPTCVGFVDVNTTDETAVLNMLGRKPLAVLNVSVLGFVREDTKKFVSRPFAVAFVHLLHRYFHLATVSTCAGLTLQSKMFGAYPLVFCAEDGMVEVGESCGVLCGSDGDGDGDGGGGGGGDDGDGRGVGDGGSGGDDDCAGSGCGQCGGVCQ